MSSDYGDEFVPLEEVPRHLGSEEVGTTSNLVGFYEGFTVTIVTIHRVRPHQIAEHTILGYLLEPINLLNLLYLNNPMPTVLSSGDMPP